MQKVPYRGMTALAAGPLRGAPPIVPASMAATVVAVAVVVCHN